MFTEKVILYNSKKSMFGGKELKKFILALGIGSLIIASCGTSGKNTAYSTSGVPTKAEYIKPTYSINEAEKIIRDYVKGMHMVSDVKVYEGKKYYIGEVYVKGYNGFDTVRKIYLSKRDKSVILPTMAETYDYKYMQTK